MLRIAVLLPEAPIMGGNPMRATTTFASFAPRLFGDRWGSPPPIPPAPARIGSKPGNAISRRTAYDVQLALLGRIGFGEPQRQPRPRPVIVHPLAPPIVDHPTLVQRPIASRLSGSAWLAVRGGSSVGLGPAGQLGGSQAGMRLHYAIGESRRVAVSARLSGPLAGRGDEAAIGLEWRPSGAPVALLVEQRFGLDGTPGGPAMMAVGGVGPTPLAGSLTIEGYGQAGAVRRAGRVEPFADGALRAALPITGRVTAGLGAWGGAQRDAARFDIGPTIGIALPVGRRNLRLSLDWRERVAGDARPGSGPALTLGSDF